MNTGTKPHELPIGVVLSERNKEILLSARALEEVLGKNNMTMSEFASHFLRGGHFPPELTSDLVVCQWQQGDEKRIKVEAALGKLSAEERSLLRLPDSGIYFA